MGRGGGGEENGLKDTSGIISAESSRIAGEAEVMLGASEGVVALLWNSIVAWG